MQTTEQSLAALTAEIASAYVSNNTIGISEIGHLIAEVGHQLQELGKAKEPTVEKPEPAVPVRRSIGSDHLICLVCGKKQRMLKRHLTSEHGLTPDSYRATFGLKPEYPMVAPSYALMRRELALKIGLGRPKKPARKKGAAAKMEAPEKTRRTRSKAA